MLPDILHFFTYTFMGIFPIVNPIGMSAVFLSLTKYHSHEDRCNTAKKVAIYSFCIYIVTLFAGSWILGFFSLTIPIIKVAGGIIIYFTAFGMLNSKPKLSATDQQEALRKTDDVTFFPLTMPITAGAGSMAVVMAIGAGIINNGVFSVRAVSELIGATLGILLLSLLVFVCYYFSDRIFAKLGNVGTHVVTQLAAFILLAVSIDVIWQGVKSLIMM